MKIASVVHVRLHAFDLTRDIVCRAASALGKGVGTGNRIKIKTKMRNKIENSGSGGHEGDLQVGFGFLKT